MNLAIVATSMSKASLSACIASTYMPDLCAYIDTLLIVHNKAKLLHSKERLQLLTFLYSSTIHAGTEGAYALNLLTLYNMLWPTAEERLVSGSFLTDCLSKFAATCIAKIDNI